MNLRTALLPTFLVVLAFSASARAQTSIYGTVTVDHVTGIKCQGTSCGSNDGTINPLGGIGGISHDVWSLGPVRLGLDVRGSSVIGNKNAAIYSNSPKPRIYSVLGGVRASARTPLLHLTPYVEGLVGYDRSNFTGGTYSSGVAFRGLAGVDFSLLPSVDFRVVELGAGSVHNSGSNFLVESVSTGLVFHLPF